MPSHEIAQPMAIILNKSLSRIRIEIIGFKRRCHERISPFTGYGWWAGGPVQLCSIPFSLGQRPHHWVGAHCQRGVVSYGGIGANGYHGLYVVHCNTTFYFHSSFTWCTSTESMETTSAGLLPKETGLKTRSPFSASCSELLKRTTRSCSL